MNENEFQNYQFLEDAAILSLNGTWRVLREKLNKKISKIKETDSLGFDDLNTLVDTLDTFEAQIRKAKSRADEPTLKSATKQVTSKSGTTKTQRTSEEVFADYIDEYFRIWQHEKIDEILAKLPDVFASVFDSFIIDVKFEGRDPEWIRKRPHAVKFQVFNLVKRFPRDKDMNEDIQVYGKCDFDYGFDLLNDPSHVYRQHLMQGFDFVEQMINHLRNFSQHKHHKDGRKILKSDLKRSIEDPVTGAESVGNMITLCSALVLSAYQFDEIIQTWIDTDTYVKGKGGV